MAEKSPHTPDPNTDNIDVAPGKQHWEPPRFDRSTWKTTNNNPPVSEQIETDAADRGHPHNLVGLVGVQGDQKMTVVSQDEGDFRADHDKLGRFPGHKTGGTLITGTGRPDILRRKRPKYVATGPTQLEVKISDPQDGERVVRITPKQLSRYLDAADIDDISFHWQTDLEKPSEDSLDKVPIDLGVKGRPEGKTYRGEEILDGLLDGMDRLGRDSLKGATWHRGEGANRHKFRIEDETAEEERTFSESVVRRHWKVTEYDQDGQFVRNIKYSDKTLREHFKELDKEMKDWSSLRALGTDRRPHGPNHKWARKAIKRDGTLKNRNASLPLPADFRDMDHSDPRNAILLAEFHWEIPKDEPANPENGEKSLFEVHRQELLSIFSNLQLTKDEVKSLSGHIKESTFNRDITKLGQETGVDVFGNSAEARRLRRRVLDYELGNLFSQIVIQEEKKPKLESDYAPKLTAKGRPRRYKGEPIYEEVLRHKGTKKVKSRSEHGKTILRNLPPGLKTDNSFNEKMEVIISTLIDQQEDLDPEQFEEVGRILRKSVSSLQAEPLDKRPVDKQAPDAAWLPPKPDSRRKKAGDAAKRTREQAKQARAAAADRLGMAALMGQAAAEDAKEKAKTAARKSAAAAKAGGLLVGKVAGAAADKAAQAGEFTGTRLQGGAWGDLADQVVKLQAEAEAERKKRAEEARKK